MKLLSYRCLTPAVLLALLALLPHAAHTQGSLSLADSLFLESIAQDTAALRGVASAAPGERKAARALYLIGLYSFKQRNWDAAEGEFRHVRSEYLGYPEGKDALYFFGRISAMRGDLGAAVRSLSDYRMEAPAGYWAEGAHYFLISAKAKLRDSTVLDEIRAFLLERPQAFYAKDAQYYLVDYYRKRGEYEQAIAEARRLVEKYPESTYAKDFVYQIGDFYCRLGRFADAIQYYEARRKEQPPSTEPAAIFQYLIGEGYERAGDVARAREEYRKVLEQHASITNWGVLSEFSEAMLLPREALAHPESTDLAQKAVAALAEFTAKHPTDKRAPSALMTTASLFRIANRDTDALRTYDQVISFDTSAISGVSSETRGKDIAACKELIIQAHLAKAHVLRRDLDQPLRALEEYNGALAKQPKCEDALFGKATVMLHLGRPEDARPLLDEIVRAGGPLKGAAQGLLGANHSQEVQP